MIKKVIIEEGVTSIGKQAFIECGYLKSVLISKTVKMIDEGNVIKLRRYKLSRRLYSMIYLPVFMILIS